MLRFVFGLIPWWIYALIAFGFVSLIGPLYQEYARDQADLNLALAIGSPAPIPVSNFRGPGVTPLDEVHLTGMIRADLGINEITDDTTSKTFVVIGPQGGGEPLIALITPTELSERMLDGLLSDTGPDATITVQGLLTSAGKSDVLAALARQGETGSFYLVEPFVNGREAALQGKARDSTIILGIVAGFTLITALAAYLKLRARLRRRAMRTAGQRPASTSQPTPQPQATTAPFNTPWGRSTPDVPPPSGVAKPQKLAVPKTKRATGHKEPVVIALEAEFKSVFPGGGSPFRFKTSEQIIRQSFGTFRTRKQLSTRTDDTNDGT